MLKMRLLWRRTSSSQAEPSPWRHCWTSWTSCSNASLASNPKGLSACQSMERKLQPKCSPVAGSAGSDRIGGHLTGGGGMDTSPVLTISWREEEVEGAVAEVYTLYI